MYFLKLLNLIREFCKRKIQFIDHPLLLEVLTEEMIMVETVVNYKITKSKSDLKITVSMKNRSMSEIFI